MKKRKCIIGILLIFGISQIFAAPCGDVNSNGVIDIVDALMTAQYYVGLDPQPYDLDAADVSGDGNVNIVDALQTAQYYVGLITVLEGCVCCPTDPPGTPPPETIEMQAEDANWENGSVEYDHSGYTGSGYVNTVNASGTWIEWSLNIANDTPAVCDFRYASADARGMDLSINGTTVASLGFADSGAWTTWVTEEAPTVSLNAGANTIRLTATSSGGAPNMDKMDITINSIRVTAPPTEPPTPPPTASPTPPGWTIPPTPEEGLIAFPGAEGYGKLSVGGRGGAVYEVTTLNSSGAGSLGAAIGASGPRTVVFKVAGNIEGTFNISNDFITIAGHTAPGDGICIKGHLNFRANDIIVRYVRVRANVDGDAISGGKGKSRMILDHLSASWSSDEVLSIYQNNYVTFQYCMITEAGSSSHKFGGIWGNWYSTYHHNLIAHNASRNPRWATLGGAGDNDYRNNVVYNWGYRSCYGGAGSEPVNMVANYYKPGPATESGVRDLIADPSGGIWYVAENVVEGSPEVTNDNWQGMDGGRRSDEPWPAMPIRQETAEEAYLTVLEHAGCSLPNRDSVDARIIEEVRTGTATYGDNGLITRPSDVGGWPTLQGGTPYPDSDHDGMDDAWETANGLNPNDPNDRNNTDFIGYTMLENFLNSIDNL